MVPVQLRNQDPQLGADDDGHGGPQPAGELPAERIQRIQERGDQGDAQHRAEGQLEGNAGQLDRRPQEHYHHGGAQKMQADPGPVQQLSSQHHHQQQGSADHRRIHAAQGTVGQQNRAVQDQPDRLAQLQKPEKSRKQHDQYAGMETADGQDMGDSQLREGGSVFGRNQGTGSQQERRGIPACFLAHFPDQGRAQAVPPGGGNAGKRENGG